ncbi:MAG: right-handed parallel beta-helix repeat-containing protein [Coriobacteriia bacterium]|nr:right-handed parallel beta-helix repeat-containing protein [Coriobacteriia bacterium]
MPCDECHVPHGRTTASIYMFSEARAGAPVTIVRQLCVGCHRPYDSAEATPVVCGLMLKRLPLDVVDHAEASDKPCSDCHGPTGHSPQSHAGGVECGGAACHGSSGSHGIHLSASDARGPGQLDCSDDCHMSGDFPYFKSGTDADTSGHIELDETTVCDECHSPGGDYDGVDSVYGSVGAKDNWASRVYASATTLKAGKEKWCAGCHDGDEGTADEEPSLIDGVYAPPVVGDEDGSYIYGTGWGYYKTGHGAPSSEVLPPNGYAAGPDLDCDACHDYALTHIDGERRTHDAGTSSGAYRASYRLDLVGGANPMEIPWASGVANDASRARLCYQTGCHLYSAINNTASQETNFWLTDGIYYNYVWRYNMHEFHLDFDYQLRWVSDYTSNAYPGDSQISCPTCHNVHGSKYLAMTSDGELTSEVYERRPGLRMWYRNNSISVWNPNDANPPTPEDIPLAASDGWIWRPATASTICSHCHGANQNTRDFNRTLWQSLGIAPILTWTGEAGYADDGSNPDSGSAADTFAFRVTYTDGNNNAPSYVVLLIDRNDDGDFGDANESATMDPDNALDSTYYNGNDYNVDVQLAKAGDNRLGYVFEASDGITGTSRTPTRTVDVTNAPPQLPWTGESGYSDDGVNPNSGTTGITNYEFRITYKDPDGEAPSGDAPTLYVDKNDDGDYDDTGEVVSMSAMAGGDWLAGKRFNHTTTLTYNVDGLVPYYFEASDGIDTVPSAISTATVLENVNQAPALSWTGEIAYEIDGVDPESQAATKPFYFRVEYTDANNDAPGTKQVWVDLNDDGDYDDVGEKVTMDDSVTTTDTAKTDADYTNGEYLAEKVYVPFAGDGTIPYCFYFTDSAAAEATGEPQDDGNQANDKTLTVFNALDVPSEYGTIQLAVNAASTGQTVLVADGTYAGFAYNGKDITVDSVNGAASTFIQGGATVVEFPNWGDGSNSTLRGFTVRNGTTGIALNGALAVIDDCVVENNSGVGILHQGGTKLLLIEDTVIRNNHPGFQNNNSAAVTTFRRTTITGNSVGGSGGGVLTSNGCDEFIFESSTLSSNTAGSNGGALYCGSNAFGGVFRDCVLQGNSAGGSGGALGFNDGNMLTLENTVVRNNVAGSNGGALWNNSGNFNAVFRDTVFEGNTATGGYGGALGFNSANTITLERCVVRGNQANTDGGGLRQGNGTYNYTNTTFSGNYAGGNGGAVCAPQNGGVPTFDFCTISGNSANVAGALYVWWHTPGTVKVHNSILYGDDSRSSATLEEIDGGGYLNANVRYTDINQAFGSFNDSTGSYTLNPFFVTPVGAGSAPTKTGDYHLQDTASCEGKADPAATLADDIDRGARPQGSGWDSGSDEIGAAAGPLSMSAPAESLLLQFGEPLPAATDATTEQTTGGGLTGSGATGKGSLGVSDPGGSARRPLGLDLVSRGRDDSAPASNPVNPAVPMAVSGATLIALGGRELLRLLAR